MTNHGIVSFIKMKLEHAVDPKEIHKMLSRAGFSEEHISEGFQHIRQAYRDVHQDLVAGNGFLPPLSKTAHAGQYSAGSSDAHLKVQHGLFSGRLRRKDFILGFLFFFGLGYVALASGALFLSAVAPELWQTILTHIADDQDGVLLLAIPFILAPITIMMLSLITRRLHNLELPGILSGLFLAFFITPPPDLYQVGYWALYVALAVLFVILLAQKGDPRPNKHGPLPESRGSFFRRIFNF